MNTRVLSIAAALILAGGFSLPATAAFLPTHGKVVPTPPGVNCSGVKIASKRNNIAIGIAVINCDNGLAYIYRRPALPVPLPLFGGAISEQGNDIDINGDVVGTVTLPTGTLPAEWPASAPPFVLPNPGNGIAQGINLLGTDIVGSAFLPTGLLQCVEYFPAPGFISSGGAEGLLTDVNRSAIAVGQVNSLAAEAPLPGGPCAVIPKIAIVAPASIALAVNDASVAVGDVTLSPGCGGLGVDMGYFFKLPAGTFSPIGLLPGDCASSGEDNDNVGDIVGFSGTSPAARQAILYNGPLTDLNTVATIPVKPWLVLNDASGVDDNREIIATGLNKKGFRRAYELW